MRICLPVSSPRAKGEYEIKVMPKSSHRALVSACSLPQLKSENWICGNPKAGATTNSTIKLQEDARKMAVTCSGGRQVVKGAMSHSHNPGDACLSIKGPACQPRGGAHAADMRLQTCLGYFGPATFPFN